MIPLANLPSVLVVAHGKYKSVKDLVDTARAKPRHASIMPRPAPAARRIMIAERFKLAAKFDAQHVPFKGGPEAFREIIADRVDFYFVPLAPARGLIQESKLAALAVSSSQRASALPNVPTTVEAGYPELGIQFLDRRVRAGQDTAAPIVERLHKEFAAALANPGVAEKLSKHGCRSDEAESEGIRCADRQGSRHEYRAGEGGRDQDRTEAGDTRVGESRRGLWLAAYAVLPLQGDRGRPAIADRRSCSARRARRSRPRSPMSS